MTPEQEKAVKDMLDDLKEPRKALTPWEMDFLTSISDQFTNYGRLSEKQLAVLERVHAEKAP